MITPIVSKNFGKKNSHLLSEALKNGAYDSLEKLFKKSSDEVIEEIKKSGLRGKGGGGAPTGDKLAPYSKR